MDELVAGLPLSWRDLALALLIVCIVVVSLVSGLVP
jgi:hypothetical protein